MLFFDFYIRSWHVVDEGGENLSVGDNASSHGALFGKYIIFIDFLALSSCMCSLSLAVFFRPKPRGFVRPRDNIIMLSGILAELPPVST